MKPRMKTQSVEDVVEIQHQNSIHRALKNYLVIRRILSYFHVTVDLLGLRFVNHVFHREATRRLRIIPHRQIHLKEECLIPKFLAVMQTRLIPEDINSFAFTSFELDLRNSVESLEQFVVAAGYHVHRLKFTSLADVDDNSFQIQEKLVLFLSHTPNIIEIELVTKTPVYIPKQNLVALSNFFPKLRVIGLDHTGLELPPQTDSVSLLSLLISRAARLNEVRFIRIKNTFMDCSHGMSAYRALGQYHNQQMPLVENGELLLLQPKGSTSMIQELIDLNPRILKLDATLALYAFRAMQVPAEVQKFWSFLATLSSTLRTLSLTVFLIAGSNTRSPSIILTIPALAVLKELEISFIAKEYFCFGTTFFVQISSNQFPALRILRLNSFLDNDVRMNFGVSSLPSVQEFHICWSSLLESSPWNQILRNVTTIHFTALRLRHAVPNLDYILRYFPRLNHLELDLYKCYSPGYHQFRITEVDCWNILTGGAAPPVSKDALLYGNIKAAAEVEEHVDGVYAIASIGNLKNLQTLVCRPGCRLNLDAIMYMTRIGRLGPLKKLTLKALVQDLQIEVGEKDVYRDLLASFHTEVSIIDHYPVQQ